ncbi:hypothetical protein [Phenylobacterium sp. J367]|uniref:hypothetical protein n=1 Tax=Phenylobacterium sp. J367 TaxID=2898435 RepID=UPI002150FE0C|nr:hypothetical protein [Phenylobacterium sp. J367]MCR5878483.1 hypothetical protein [Phenylobacterium sp. J367]
MKRLFVSAALLPLAYAASASAETKITTATTTPVQTATVANGARDDLTVEATGSIKPTTSGAAVTLNSSNAVKSSGTVGFDTGVNNSTALLVLGGNTGSVSNSGVLLSTEDYTPTDTDNDGDLDGLFAQGSNRVGLRVTGPGAFTGDIRNEAAGSISIEGNDSAGILMDTRLNGSLINGGAVSVIGDRSVGISATDISVNADINGTVQVRGEASNGVVLGDVGGAVRMQGVISVTGYRDTTRFIDSVRAKLDADDLKQGGAGLKVVGNVAGGVILDTRPADNDANDTDEDDDGVADASEGNASINVVGAAPAIAIGAADRATTIGLVGAGDKAYGLVIKGEAVGSGLQDGVASTGVRIGEAGGGVTTIVNGINILGGRVSATSYGADVTAQGGAATGLLINQNGVVPALRNSGTIEAILANGSQDARAVVDLSGSLSLVENTGVIRALSTPRTGSTNAGQAIALDLRANVSGATVRQTKATSTSTPAILGDVLFGSGADRLEIQGGTLTGAMGFGTGADTLVIDAGGVVTGRLTDTDGRLDVSVGGRPPGGDQHRGDPDFLAVPGRQKRAGGHGRRGDRRRDAGQRLGRDDRRLGRAVRPEPRLAAAGGQVLRDHPLERAHRAGRHGHPGRRAVPLHRVPAQRRQRGLCGHPPEDRHRAWSQSVGRRSLRRGVRQPRQERLDRERDPLAEDKRGLPRGL